MEIHPAIPAITAVVLIAMVAWLYMTCLWFLGFPDGFITEREAAEAPIIRIFNGFSLTMAFWFLVLAIVAGHRRIGRVFGWSLTVQLAVAIVAAAIDWHYHQKLMGGEGG